MQKSSFGIAPILLGEVDTVLAIPSATPLGVLTMLQEKYAESPERHVLPTLQQLRSRKKSLRVIKKKKSYSSGFGDLNTNAGFEDYISKNQIKCKNSWDSIANETFYVSNLPTENGNVPGVFSVEGLNDKGDTVIDSGFIFAIISGRPRLSQDRIYLVSAKT